MISLSQASLAWIVGCQKTQTTQNQLQKYNTFQTQTSSTVVQVRAYRPNTKPTFNSK